MQTLLIILLVLLGLVALYFLYKWLQQFFKKTHHLPTQKWGLKQIPAIPYHLRVSHLVETLVKLAERDVAVEPAKYGLSKDYEINGHTANAFAYMYGADTTSATPSDRKKAILDLKKTLDKPFIGRTIMEYEVNKVLVKPDRPPQTKEVHNLTTFSLEKPEQFSMSWTTFYNIHSHATKDVLNTWSKSLVIGEAKAAATEQFWPTIARYGLAYNLLMLQKVSGDHLQAAKQVFGDAWQSSWDQLAQQGLLYAIDLSIFEHFEAQKVKNFPRFTPATYTLLQQDDKSKALKPIAIRVSGYKGQHKQIYDISTATDSAWLYALQAAKTSVTVYGIWLGHVYHWHIVTAAMQMTFFNNVGEDHPLYQLLSPQFKYLIEFDVALLVLWKNIAPPTSFASNKLFLELCNQYATDRLYFDDDPIATLDRHGIKEADFTVNEPWDQYPIVPYLLDVWNATHTYVANFMKVKYPTDDKVINDNTLRQWINASGDVNKGNVKGLPPMDSTANLQKLLTSLLYRLSAHGSSRINQVANPGLTFVANFPPCLQKTDIPAPDATLSQQDILNYLPKTGTIGEMINFYYIFSFSAPYEPFVPVTGVNQELFFTGEGSKALNDGLIAFRQEMIAILDRFMASAKLPSFPVDETLVHQWPLNIET